MSGAQTSLDRSCSISPNPAGQFIPSSVLVHCLECSPLSATDWTFLLIDIDTDVRAPASSSDSSPSCGEHEPMGSGKLLKEATSPGTLGRWKGTVCSEPAAHLPSGLRQREGSRSQRIRGNAKLKRPESYCHS